MLACMTNLNVFVGLSRKSNSGRKDGLLFAKLASLERLLGPTDLLEKVRAMVLSKKGNALDFNFEDGSTDDIQTQLERMEANARILGKAVATDEDVFSELLPELVSSEGRMWSFG